MTRRPPPVNVGETRFRGAGTLDLRLQRHALDHRVTQRLRKAPIADGRYDLAASVIALGQVCIDVREEGWQRPARLLVEFAAARLESTSNERPAKGLEVPSEEEQQFCCRRH